MHYIAMKEQVDRRKIQMQYQLTVRLSEDLDKGVATLAKKLHLKRSDIVRMALERFLESVVRQEESSPYERVHRLIGSLHSGISDLGEAHREHLLNKFRKHA
jgi:Arc/MetJ-type ribon-helix-helix transcriptional regulator